MLIHQLKTKHRPVYTFYWSLYECPGTKRDSLIEPKSASTAFLASKLESCDGSDWKKRNRKNRLSLQGRGFPYRRIARSIVAASIPLSEDQSAFLLSLLRDYTAATQQLVYSTGRCFLGREKFGPNMYIHTLRQ